MLILPVPLCNWFDTSLQLAVDRGHNEVVKLLLEHGANVDVQSKGGDTILHCAVENGDSVIIEHILKHGPDVNNDPLLRSI